MGPALAGASAGLCSTLLMGRALAAASAGLSYVTHVACDHTRARRAVQQQAALEGPVDRPREGLEEVADLAERRLALEGGPAWT